MPGDRPERMAKALHAGADALIFDLEDSVALVAKEAAREAVAAFLRATERSTALFVRVNPLDGGLIDADLAAVIDARPDGLVLPKAEGGASVTALVERLGRAIPILPIATETPAAVFALGSYASVAAHLGGLTWEAEDLSVMIGATTSRESDGRFTAPYELARSLTLFGAHAGGILAIETVYPAFRDLDGLVTFAARAARDGFTGMMAIHPSQVPVINTAFAPSAEAVAFARRILAAFEASPGAGALQLDGKMIDMPHLKLARSLLGRAREQ